ncbi:conserved hypothetical protein [Streptomyces viridochromogenes DSM 40736]|uniref:LigA protein n=1 Tax=Streptomyces viridochromogenes (strain DSM 40736 / JCM 4977 / BCRC 1201 / Tue 494) TaxID=591159 RepID=D9X9V9_STRVT|nr:hypothetical protein [Streptomyces viridochromogenes]EFL34339.1 conserved hypothetical protein [Streptomyces viridochromogenes DSM 40736]
MSDKPSDDQPSASEIPDDVWEQFTRDTERDIRASAPKEPSARARMVTERLRQQDARGETPPGWRTDPVRQERNVRTARRRKLWAVLGVPAAVAVALVALKPSLLPGDPFGTGTSQAADPLPAETAAPTAPPGASDPETPTLDEPFAGSPALRWADGEAGIVLPEAKAVGAVSKGRVEQALKLAKKLLVSANLDLATVRGERPEAALSVLDPQQPGTVDDLDTALRSPSREHDPLTLFSRFDPDRVRLVGDVIKTRGRMTLGKGSHGGVAVHADYTFVYPVTRADGSTEVARTIVRRAVDVELADPARYRVTAGRLLLLKYDEEIGNSSCDVHDGYLHPEFPLSRAEATRPTGPTTDPYDRSRSLDDGDACGTVSRT